MFTGEGGLGIRQAAFLKSPKSQYAGLKLICEKCCDRRGEYISDHLPCAGITLFRFYGYNLSLVLRPRRLGRQETQHPEESEKTLHPDLQSIARTRQI